MDSSIMELTQKIDTLSAQVAYLTEQAQIAERQRQERTELVHDITPLANQAFGLAVEQLEEIQEYIDLGDLLRLAKRLLRNGRNLEKILDQLESLADLLETVSPLADDAFGKAVDILAQLEAKGYFVFTRGAVNIADHVVASFSGQDLDRIGDSVKPAMNLIKQLAQPEIINMADRTFSDVKAELAKPIDASYSSLIRRLRDPATRRGLALTLRILHVIGAQAAQSGKNSKH
jgi:uncharacterized protein YjgD (DUF1641 family)